MTLDKNTFPYYNDWDEAKKYLQIIFRPGYAVQARELSQIQSVLQNQISRFGKHVFKEGSMVIPGESSLDTQYSFLKLEDQFDSIDIDVTDFSNKHIIGKTSKTIASILQGVALTGVDSNTLYIKIESGESSQTFSGDITNGSAIITGIVDSSLLITGISVSGANIPVGSFITEIINSSSIRINQVATSTGNITITASTGEEFVSGEEIITIETIPTDTAYSARLISTNATGFGSKVQIQEGIYFVDGQFCLVDEQVLILDKYSNTPSYKVGLLISDSFITADDDISLNDPATGSPNFNAPGADRYKVELILSKIELTSDSGENFVEIMRVEDGVIQSLANRADYSELEKTLARRTFDESGDYTVRFFPLHIKEHLDDGENGGVYSASNGGDETKLVLALEPGKAYIKGFEIETYATNNLIIDKSRNTNTTTDISTNFNLGNYVDVDNKLGMFLIDDTGTVATFNETLNLRSAVTHGGTTLGTAKIRGQEFISGTPGTTGAVYRLYLYDIVMTGTNLFSDVRSIGTSTVKYGDIVLADTNADAVLISSEQNISLVSLPEYAIKEFTSVGYTVRRNFSGALTGNAITLSAGSGELFDSDNILNYQVAVTSTGVVVNTAAAGNSVVLGGSPTGTQVTITITDPSITGQNVSIIATIVKANKTEKSKTLTDRTQSGVAHASTITLDKSDIFELVSIIDATTSDDITTHYRLDNGQRDNYYDRGSLIFNTDYAAPAGNVNISYKYFAHGTGDYFSVDSYNSVIDYKDIQYYSASTGHVYDLINCLDFRPRINDAGTGFSVASEIPISDTTILTDYEFYLARKDKIILNVDGTFAVLSGSSGISPTWPKEPVNSMVLYNIDVPPYGFNIRDISFNLVDNKRYTMRDIGKLETRIGNLEYYTSLSLLEKATADMFIDDGTGANRFKNGFVVDNFSTYNVGDVSLPDYKVALDIKNGIMRPQFTKENVGLSVDITSNPTTWQKTGDLITLPYTITSYISQLFASKTENINPYDVYNWIGNIILNPGSDDWYDTLLAPDIVIVDESGFNASLAAQNGNVVWNDWETAWTGESTTIPTDGNIVTGHVTSGHKNVADKKLTSLEGRLPNEFVFTGKNGSYVQGIYRDVVSTEVGQTRTGIQTVVTTNVNNQIIDEKIVDKSSIPYMRSIEIDFEAFGLKPNTTVYPFFDEIPVSIYCSPSELITDKFGAVSGTFTVPNSDTQRFRTGNRVFRLIDSQSNNTSQAACSADVIYSATGTLETVQNTVLSTRTSTLVTNSVSEERVNVSSEIVEFKTAKIWVDPLAQTFLINKAGGLFVPKIDIFFSEKDTNNIPVRLQLRNVIGGYPGENIIPFGEVSLNPEDVNVSVDGSIPTSFTFDSPIYLQDGQEYCFVLLANSNQYNIYCSRLGEFDILSGDLISSQPYAGSMFKSQNASTWTPDQEQDIKFDIHRCVFNTVTPGLVLFENDELSIVNLKIDPFTTTSASSVVTIIQPNHGLVDGESTTISGVSGTQNGIDDTDLNQEHIIAYIDIDSYTIDCGSGVAADETGICGGNSVYATGNNIVDVTNINIQNMVFDNTSLNWGIKTIPLNDVIETSFSGITMSNNLVFMDPRIVRSEENEIASAKSLFVQATLETSNDSISPVVDTGRASGIMIGNRINEVFDSNLLAEGELDASGGSSIAKYITKKIVLSESATGVKVFFSAIRPAPATIQVFIKYLPAQSEVIFDTLDYEEMAAVDYPAFDTSTLKDYTFELQDLVPFNNFAIKVVMLSSDSAEVPLIMDFRAIACI